MFSGVFYALLAGFLGAVASSSAKLSLGSDYLKGVCENGLKSWALHERHFRQADETTVCDWLHIPLRLLCGGLLFTCNAVMWTCFAKALRYSSSSARATVTTTASNFISSAQLRSARPWNGLAPSVTQKDRPLDSRLLSYSSKTVSLATQPVSSRPMMTRLGPTLRL
ncbi:uncharacterized protein LOC117435389 isoform X1 [Acipenser ruthenus]|uniref:uncharacterized protein LOC117435389 isoform X1 n=1 Tax=Acipenser ruthenus TaxID=7906 RepID=UPI0027426570|nr:uncharacterized protein LOC117435389 isoform X1 [Acipenser ruthenus]